MIERVEARIVEEDGDYNAYQDGNVRIPTGEEAKSILYIMLKDADLSSGVGNAGISWDTVDQATDEYFKGQPEQFTCVTEEELAEEAK